MGPTGYPAMAVKPMIACQTVPVAVAMPKPVRRCSHCRRHLPPWAKGDAVYCGSTCRKAAHRTWHRRTFLPRARVSPAGPVKVRERAEQIADIEGLMASFDADVERIMANVAKIRTKPGAAGA